MIVPSLLAHAMWIAMFYFFIFDRPPPNKRAIGERRAALLAVQPTRKMKEDRLLVEAAVGTVNCCGRDVFLAHFSVHLSVQEDIGEDNPGIRSVHSKLLQPPPAQDIM